MIRNKLFNIIEERFLSVRYKLAMIGEELNVSYYRISSNKLSSYRFKI